MDNVTGSAQQINVDSMAESGGADAMAVGGLQMYIRGQH